jgi:hypothetical protein
VPGIHKVDSINGNCYIIAREDLIVIVMGMPDSEMKGIA